jgi:alkanesulfonate monooxygenase SsuD/methylene tetrahydromethanopterin reductase-like flavin-dependent oxidoreductase (luciferase family)
VKLGLYFDLRNPAPWARPWPEVYGRALDLVVEAERLGAASVWFSEHHLFTDGYLPQPLTFAAAAAARTSRVRIGTAVLVAALRPAALVAEEAAVIDQLSGGRLELGIGAGYSVPEYELYNADITKRYGLTDAAVAEIRRLLDDGIVTPPAAQNPFPVWLGYQGPQGAKRAGRLGVGLLSLDRSLLDPYREGLVEGGHDPEIARTGGMLDIIVADDPEEAFERILPHYAHQLNSYRAAAVAGSGRDAPKEITVEKLRGGAAQKGQIPGLRVLTPTDAVTAIRDATEGSPVEHVYLWASVAGMPDDLVERHVELTCTQVAPTLEPLTTADDRSVSFGKRRQQPNCACDFLGLVITAVFFGCCTRRRQPRDSCANDRRLDTA